MFVYISIILSLIGLIYATYTDLKERIVPNKLNFGLTIIALVLYLANSIWANSLWPITYSVIGLAFGFLFGWILWKIGVFAGGDVKLFMALGALNPFTPTLINSGILTNFHLPIFPITLFLHSLIAFLPYGLIVVIYKIYKNKKFQEKLKIEIKKRIYQALNVSVIIASTHILISQFINNFFIETIIIFGILIIWNKLNEKKIFLTFILLLPMLIFAQEFLNLFISISISLIILYILTKLMFLVRPLLSNKIEIKNLEEGMIPAVTLIKKGNKIVKKEDLSFKLILKLIKKGKLNDYFKEKNEIISSIKARGLIDEEIKELKKLSKKRLIGKTILIKDSMPFVPTMLLGYAISLIMGDAIILFILGI